jgi:hypothetical protein
MHTSQPIRLREQLDIVRHTVPDIQPAVLIRLIRHFKQTVHFLLVDSDAPGQFRQTLVGLVAWFMHYVDVEILGLLREERFAEFPEFVGRLFEYSGAGFVDKSAGGVPGLDLLARRDVSLALHRGRWQPAYRKMNWTLSGYFCFTIGKTES